MTGSASDGHIDRLVKARWLAIGLSQSDLAEILGAAFESSAKTKGARDNVGVDRLIDVAEALDIPADRLRERAAGQGAAELKTAGRSDTLHSLLDLRLLRAFCLLRDQRTKLMFVHLAEQIAKRQANCTDDAS
jgi:transcriptional regulator with XRE-family HTH domain